MVSALSSHHHHHIEPIHDWQQPQNSSCGAGSRETGGLLPVSPKTGDVLFGKSNFRHPGNVTFRSLCADRVHDYLQASARMSKGRIAQEIVDQVARGGGRFLRKLDESDKSSHALWIQVDNKTAQTKAAHTLRDAISNRNKCVMNMHVQQQQQKKALGCTTATTTAKSKPDTARSRFFSSNNNSNHLPNNLPPFINISMDNTATSCSNNSMSMLNGPVTFPPRDLSHFEKAYGSASSTSSSSGASSSEDGNNPFAVALLEEEEASLTFMDTSPVKTEVLQEDLISLGDGSLESTDSLFDEGRMEQMNLY